MLLKVYERTQADAGVCAFLGTVDESFNAGKELAMLMDIGVFLMLGSHIGPAAKVSKDIHPYLGCFGHCSDRHDTTHIRHYSHVLNVL